MLSLFTLPIIFIIFIIMALPRLRDLRCRRRRMPERHDWHIILMPLLFSISLRHAIIFAIAYGAYYCYFDAAIAIIYMPPPLSAIISIHIAILTFSFTRLRLPYYLRLIARHIIPLFSSLPYAIIRHAISIIILFITCHYADAAPCCHIILLAC